MRNKIFIILLIVAIGLLLVNGIFNNVLYTSFKNTVVPLDSFTNYPRASDYGLRADNEDSARFNGDLMKAAMAEFGGIIIDGRYFMKLPSNMEMDKVGIIGDSEYNSELIFSPTYSTTLFDSAVLQELYISDVKFVNTSNEDLVIARSRSELTMPINSIIIKNNEFIGDISAYRLEGDGNIDPTTSPVVLDTFVFDNNDVSNTNYTFLRIQDVPYNSVNITNNRITNFQYIFANLQLTNENIYNPELFDLRKQLTIQGNTVISEDDWWSTGTGSTYYAFVVAEGDKVLYADNHVEGLKANLPIALYDAYLSCNEVIYENNIWKNNVALSLEKKFSAFMKSKNGSKPLYRVYRNNEFIVEQSFADKFNMDPMTLMTDFISLENHASYYEITNNNFSGYYIRFPESSRFIENLVFKNNKIDAELISGSVVNLQANDEFSQGSIVFSENTISAKEHYTLEGSSLPLFKFYDHSTVANTSILSLIDYSNNWIDAPINYLFMNTSEDFFDVDYASIDTSFIPGPLSNEIIQPTDRVYKDRFDNITIVPEEIRFSYPTIQFNDLNLELIDSSALEPTPPSDTTSPVIVDYTPQTTIDVPSDQSLMITFDEDISVVNINAIQLLVDNTDVKTDAVVEGNVLTISHDTLLLGAEYTLAIASGSLEDMSSNAFGSFNLVFTTVEPIVIDSDSPIVVDYSPLDAFDIESDQLITITFDENIQVVNLEGIQLILDNVDVKTGYNVSENVLTVLHDSLVLGSDYSVNIAEGSIEDLNQNSFGTFEFQFRTLEAPDLAPPEVVNYTPLDSVDIPEDQLITVLFDEEIVIVNPDGIQLIENTVDVKTSYEVIGNEITIFHDPLLLGTDYSVIIADGSIEDKSANGFGGFNIPFRTIEPVVESQDISVVQTSPSNGGKNIKRDVAIIITFDKDISSYSIDESKIALNSEIIYNIDMFDANSITITPSELLPSTTDITVVLEEGALSTENGVSEAYSFKFRTRRK